MDSGTAVDTKRSLYRNRTILNIFLRVSADAFDCFWWFWSMKRTSLSHISYSCTGRFSSGDIRAVMLKEVLILDASTSFNFSPLPMLSDQSAPCEQGMIAHEAFVLFAVIWTLSGCSRCWKLSGADRFRFGGSGRIFRAGGSCLRAGFCGIIVPAQSTSQKMSYSSGIRLVKQTWYLSLLYAHT